MRCLRTAFRARMTSSGCLRLQKKATRIFTRKARWKTVRSAIGTTWCATAWPASAKIYYLQRAGTAVTGPFGTTYYGNVVTITGANGYQRYGSSPLAYSPLPASYLPVSNRDELHFQSDHATHAPPCGALRVSL